MLIQLILIYTQAHFFNAKHHGKQAMKSKLRISFLGLTLPLFILSFYPVHNAFAQGRSLAKVDNPIESKVVLTLISQDKPIKLTMADIKALPQKTFFSKSPWYPGRMKMTGPLIRDVLTKYKLKGEIIEALALDDYKTKIPISDVMKYDIVLVHTSNDFPLTVKTKGYLWVAYPFDDNPELQSYKHYERSIWQLKTFTIR
jgi:hypothetical protein